MFHIHFYEYFTKLKKCRYLCIILKLLETHFIEVPTEKFSFDQICNYKFIVKVDIDIFTKFYITYYRNLNQLVLLQ